MINWHSISSSSGAAAYHDKAFTQDGNIQRADNYYLDKQAGATWQGQGARLLGIEGKEVTKEEFVAMLDGKVTNPATGREQDLSVGGNSDRRKGVDLVISAPKSISMVALMEGGDDRLIEAHKQASQEAMQWLETNGALLRVKEPDGSVTTHKSENLIWATIKHETNRDNEPQLHTHNVLMAMTYDVDAQKWRSLTNDEMMVLRANADHVYKGALHSSVAKLGYETVQTADGFEIKGLSRDQLMGMSGRSQGIDEAIRARGYDPEAASWSMRQNAALATRKAKVEIPYEVLKDAWSRKGEELGLDVAALVGAAKDRALTLDFQALAKEERRLSMVAVSEAIEHLSEREQAFKVAQLEASAMQLGRVPVSGVREAIKAHIDGHQLLEGAAKNSPVPWFTTQKALDNERRVVEIIQDGIGKGNAIVKSECAFQALKTAFEERKTVEAGKPFKLSQEQTDAARAVLMHGDKFQGIQGDAGTGKTAGMEFVREAAEASGWHVHGVATMGRAAEELAKSTGMQANTVASFFSIQDKAVRSLQMDIDLLKHKLQSNAQLQNTDAPRIEIRTLEAKSFDLNFGVSKYTFDHQRGEVYRMGDGLLSKIGAQLMDKASERRATLSSEQNLNTLGRRVGAYVEGKLYDAGESIGSRLVRFERVDAIEASAARIALHDANRSEQISRIFKEIDRKEAQISNWQKFGNAEGKPTLYVMDETSMTGVADGAKLLAYVDRYGARGVFQGDAWQHGSVAAGKMFSQMQESGLNISRLTETRRFDNAIEPQKEAVRLYQERKFQEAIKQFEVRPSSSEELYAATANTYFEKLMHLREINAELQTVGVVAFTNADRKESNLHVRAILQANNLLSINSVERDHLDEVQFTGAQSRNVGMLAQMKVTHLVYSQNYKEMGISRSDVVIVERFDINNNRVYGRVESTGRAVMINPDKQFSFSPYKKEGRKFSVGDQVEARAKIDDYLIRGRQGVVTGVSGDMIKVMWANEIDRPLTNNESRFVDYAYAHTSQKEQGQSVGVEIACISETGAKVMNREGNLVMGTRAKHETIVVSSAAEMMYKNATKEPEKTTALGLVSTNNEMGKRMAAVEHTMQTDAAHAQAVGADQSTGDKGRSSQIEKGGAEHSL